MTITLPDTVRLFLSRRAQQAGLASVDEYVLHVVLQADPDDFRPLDLDTWLRSALADPPGEAGAISTEAIARRREEIEEALLRGAASGRSQEATPEYWTERQHKLSERHHRPQSSDQA